MSKVILNGLGTCLFIVVSSALGTLGVANADLLQITFSGDIDIANDSGPLLGMTSISDTSSFAGKFTYDTETASTSSGPNWKAYPVKDFNITIDGYVFGVNNPEAYITNDGLLSPSGNYDRLGAGGRLSDGLVLPFPTSGVYLPDFLVAMSLTDSTATAFNSFLLPNAVNLASFDAKFINFTSSYGDLAGQLSYDFQIAGNIDNLDVAPAPIPEPATMLLFGTGLVGLVGSRLRKKKK